ncbi:ABC-type uncharacterized transport system, auxiliary component [Hartmannibacter diazotrophicus]|uniref:ABC-type uncharacterized transport system, auxiliary component n=1 Tax=Hartmannibacter diazotrophicus TaxID=1482074 RepID=A0A2C9D7F6_9HYPH|nr:ABC-type transport auxiliary lipoprotein family protein [Hartmannibacter diazotrophicus]SON56252.1 ABC-type uncharacterized transport system, auxiliary component [Hartmannibacter diazotrophicus]
MSDAVGRASRLPRGFGKGQGRWLVLFGCALGLAGCSALGATAPAPSIFDLTLASLPQASSYTGRTGAQLLVPKPTAVSALDTSRIVVNPAVGEIEYLKGAQWSDDLPSLVQMKVVRAFEDSGRMRAVGRPGESLAIDYQVIVDIRRFAYLTSPRRMVLVEFGVKLLNDRTGKVLATKVFEAEAPVGVDRAGTVVTAFDAAASKAVGEMVEWTLQTL